MGVDFKELLEIMLRHGISDIHFKADTPPVVRVNGKIISSGFDVFKAEDVEELAETLMDDREKSEFQKSNDLDMSYTVAGVSRFRLNAYRERGNIALNLRVVPLEVKSFADLHLPPDILTNLCHLSRGLILVSGITGAGKTTTMNAMIDYVNQHLTRKIITVEDPIEFFHNDKKSFISQREVGKDTRSYKNALKYILRQDPDIVVIGEMRDYDSISAGIIVAETGHLVLSTIHTIDAVQTIERIIASYPPHQQNQMRQQLVTVLKAVVGQRLLASTEEKIGMVPAIEVLINTASSKRLIEDNKTRDIYKVMEKGDYYGMRTFDQDIYRLCVDKKISVDVALDNATNRDDLQLKLRGVGVIEE